MHCFQFDSHIFWQKYQNFACYRFNFGKAGSNQVKGVNIKKLGECPKKAWIIETHLNFRLFFKKLTPLLDQIQTFIKLENFDNSYLPRTDKEAYLHSKRPKLRFPLLPLTDIKKSTFALQYTACKSKWIHFFRYIHLFITYGVSKFFNWNKIIFFNPPPPSSHLENSTRPKVSMKLF